MEPVRKPTGVPAAYFIGYLSLPLEPTAPPKTGFRLIVDREAPQLQKGEVTQKLASFTLDASGAWD